ncbi:MAG: hypothetical protein K8I30_06095, partial [Anaerolineae bacterium]|nr:hypothetical protein [Anaerolineae bacterium]
EQTIGIIFQPGWSWDDVRAAGQKADQLIVDAPHRVDLLIDIRKAGGLPRDFLSQAGELLDQGSARANEGEKVIVGANWLIRTAYQGFLTVYGHRLEGRPLRFAADLNEAQQILDPLRRGN